MADKPMSRYTRRAVVCPSVWLGHAQKQRINRSSRFRALEYEVANHVPRAGDIGTSFKTVRDRPMVSMGHKWQVDPGGSESVMTFGLR